MMNKAQTNAGTKWSSGIALVLLMAALGLAGCAGGTTPVTKAEEPPAAAPEPATFEHTVQWPGETLSIIAKWYTGDAKNWAALARENPSVSPNKLKIGTRIQIPKNLLIKTDPLPRSSVKTQKPKSKRIPKDQAVSERGRGGQPEASGEAEAAEIPDAPAEPRKTDLDLFGPKE